MFFVRVDCVWEWVPFESGLALPFLYSWVGPGQPRTEGTQEKERPTRQQKPAPNPKRKTPALRFGVGQTPTQKERMGKARPSQKWEEGEAKLRLGGMMGRPGQVKRKGRRGGAGQPRPKRKERVGVCVCVCGRRCPCWRVVVVKILIVIIITNYKDSFQKIQKMQKEKTKIAKKNQKKN